MANIDTDRIIFNQRFQASFVNPNQTILDNVCRNVDSLKVALKGLRYPRESPHGINSLTVGHP